MAEIRNAILVAKRRLIYQQKAAFLGPATRNPSIWLVFPEKSFYQSGGRCCAGVHRAPGPRIALSASELSYIAEYHQRPRDHLLSLCDVIWQSHARAGTGTTVPCVYRGYRAQKRKTSGMPGGFENMDTTRGQTAGTSWSSFGTAYRRGLAPSHFERGLNPARPGLSLGVFRRFGTMACLSRRRLA
jgi:hypothetical protein